jgi:hypothetical protein
MATRGRYSSGFHEHSVADFRLDRIELVQDADKQQELTLRMRRMNAIRTSPSIAAELDTIFDEVSASPERRAVLGELKDLFFPPSGKRCANVCHVFHGAGVDTVDSILRTGLVRLSREDDGFFGHGCYATPSVEYAARYATGELSAHGPRPPDPTGCWPVIMFAALTAVAYPVTREDYATPSVRASKSKYFGKTLRHGVVDAHVVAVNQGHTFQACPADSADYLEVVCSEPANMLPLAVLWLRR